MRFTIITPTLNSVEFLPQALSSILDQKGQFELESLVIDGQSSDATLQVLRGMNDPRLRWISEPDSGQAGALNKGLAMASGDIIGWLNADDCYCPKAFEIVRMRFAQSPESQWLIGQCDIIDRDGQIIRQNITEYKNKLLESFGTKSLLRMNMISQPSVFWRQDFGRSIGPLDESLHWTMDYDLWLRMSLRSKPIILDKTLACFRVHDQSKSRGGRRAQFEEGYRVACRHCGGDWVSRMVHRINVEKIVWGYSAMRLFGK